MTGSAEAADVGGLHHNKISALLKSVTILRAYAQDG
jgi:hypothetical protein